MMNTEPSQKPTRNCDVTSQKDAQIKIGTHGIRNRDLSTGATGALSIELIHLFTVQILPDLILIPAQLVVCFLS
jgi:hypothetical protein